MQATYISSNQFKVSTDKTSEFLTGRRVRALCGSEYKYSTVYFSTYSSPDTTVTLEEGELTSNLSEVHYGIVNIGEQGSFPKHSHDGNEGTGGVLSLLNLEDTPSSYEEGKYLRSTTSGVVLDDLNDYYYTESEIDTISGSLQTNIDGKSDTSHLHDDRYYTETELNNGQLDDRYYTESEIDTISGSLQTNIDGKPDTEIFLTEGVPSNYVGKAGDIAVNQEVGTIYKMMIEYGFNTTTWNPSDKSADITLSNNDLTAFSETGSGYRGVRSVFGVSSGKWYWEITCDQNSTGGSLFQLGVGTSATILNNDLCSDVNAYIYTGAFGKGCGGGGCAAYGTGYTAVDVIGIALDMDNGKIWFSKNGSWEALGDPTAGTNPTCAGLSGIFFAIWGDWGTGGKVTANFGASAFSHSVPSGFVTGLGEISGGWEEKLSPDFLKLSDTPTTYSGVSGKYLKTTNSGIEFSDDELYTKSEVDTISGSLQSGIDNKSDINHLHDDRYYTESEIDTISGTLQINIDSKPETLIDLIDTPSSYDDGKYLISTASGIDWTTLSGVEGSVWHTGSGVPETPITCSGTDGLYDLSDTNRLSGSLTTGKSDLVDGDTTTSVTAQITVNHSFGIDFGEEKQLDCLDVYGYISGGTATGEWQAIGGYDIMTVYGSNDNSTWVQIGSQHTSPPVSDYVAGTDQTFRVRFTFSIYQSYRYLKITGDNTLYFYSPSRAVSWCELAAETHTVIGISGDYYLNTDNGDVYKKSGTIWVYEANIKGDSGSVWYSDVGLPGAAITYTCTDGLYDLSDATRTSGALITGKSDLVDADTTTSVTAQIQNNHSFGIDLGAENNVDHLDVYGYIANGTATGEWQASGSYDRMTVYGSNDNSTWVQIGDQYIAPPVHEYTAGVSQTFRTRLSFSETKTHRYFKVTGDVALYFYSPSRPVSWCEIVVRMDAFDIGVDGDYYLDTDNGNVYKKSDGSWVYDTNINGDDAPDTFLGLTDTPTTYSGSSGKYLKTTSSGIEFSDIDSEYWESVDVFLDENYSNDKGLPTQVERGLFKGYSMPIWSTPANQYEELVFRIRIPFRWDGVTNPTFMISVSISATEDIGDKFKFQMEWESKGVSDVIPDTTAEILTDEVAVTDGTAYYSYLASASLDASKLITGDNLQFRVRRVVATDPQVSNEIIIWHWDSRWKMNKLGTISE